MTSVKAEEETLLCKTHMTLSKSSTDTHRLTTDEEARAALISSDPGQSLF